MTWLRKLAVLLALFVVGFTVCPAETVAGLPAPTGYVNDFAGVLTPDTKQSLEALCTDVDKQAHAQIAVVTIKTIDGDQSIDEFAVALEEKWKVGAKGTDRGLLMLFVMTPRAGRIEVGYGLEGILNDAKVGDIGRTMSPAARQNDYNTAIPLGVQAIAQVIATDAGVTLNTAQPIHRYHREGAQQQQTIHLSVFQMLVVGGVLLLILFALIKTGNVGLIFFLLGNLMGGGGGGGRGRDDDDRGGGGGFGGFGGGSSGGGGASGDW